MRKFMILVRCLSFVLVLLYLHNPQVLWAQTADEIAFFEAKIRPTLVTHCYECHSTKSGKARGGLKLDSSLSMLTGGDSGPAVVPRSLAKSLLYESILYMDDGNQMPPKGKLPDSVIADFRTWIQMGAPDPRVTKIGPEVKSEIDIEEGRQFWAYQTPVLHSAPESENSSWARTTIDKFVISGLDEQGLQPVDDAGPETLVRRLYFTLIGLPPTPNDVSRWTSKIGSQIDDDTRQQAVTELVSELLDSPRFGERWGRHWMDVARYAESTGGDHNNIYQHAWRYRDYVIDSFNDDKPFDQFIREQVAGDLLPIADDEEWANNVIASGFLALGVKLVGEEDQQKFFADVVDEQIDTTTRAFLATTVACARCHDHKFDPIPQEDYYALAGIFRSTETHYGLLKAQARQATTLLDLTGMGPPPGTPTLNQEELAALIKQRDDATEAVTDAMAKIRAGENVFRGMLRRLRSQRDETEVALQAYSSQGEPRVFAMGTQDRDHPLQTRLLLRGEIDKPAQTVPRGVLQVASPPSKHRLPTRTEGSGRLQLANWIAWEQNPLTARVIANRVWHWMFGRGLVRTVDDFGHSGDRPTHPELLDYLALRLIENDWSIKSLIREIALSRTWQLSSEYREANFAIDPDNNYLWRTNQRRLEGEVIRDAMLAVSGQLKFERPVGTYLREVGEGGVGQNVFEPVIRSIDAKTRSVYLPRVRSVLPEMLEAFDAPDASLVSGSRETTSSPVQALFLMNNQFVREQAIALAEKTRELPTAERIDVLYELAFGRSPTVNEKELGIRFLASADSSGTDQPDSADSADSAD
ncbi:MAG: PSD1 and planctomycete cytochrome C domain-containing protein, partial [Planctomycetota bacterium]